MAICAVFDVPGMTGQQYDETIEALQAAGQASPAGRLHHVAAAGDGGWLVVDVWRTQAELDDFAEVLLPILERVGAPRPEPRIYPVHNVIAG
ncbi:MAG: hypothetical protein D6696_21210 [Acidobacteria bacterium]|nr:MAG: hypothetical protein D6696_21210 [Acidobacteriota bacterium]